MLFMLQASCSHHSRWKMHDAPLILKRNLLFLLIDNNSIVPPSSSTINRITAQVQQKTGKKRMKNLDDGLDVAYNSNGKINTAEQVLPRENSAEVSKWCKIIESTEVEYLNDENRCLQYPLLNLILRHEDYGWKEISRKYNLFAEIYLIFNIVQRLLVCLHK